MTKNICNIEIKFFIRFTYFWYQIRSENFKRYLQNVCGRNISKTLNFRIVQFIEISLKGFCSNQPTWITIHLFIYLMASSFKINLACGFFLQKITYFNVISCIIRTGLRKSATLCRAVVLIIKKFRIIKYDFNS